jgi:Fic family protein
LFPSPHLLVRPYMLREALASTRIEGTRASLAGVLEAEVGGDTGDPDVEEVVNYVRAMELGLSLLDELPYRLRLIREMHAVLLEGVRGEGSSTRRNQTNTELDWATWMHTQQRLVRATPSRRNRRSAV